MSQSAAIFAEDRLRRWVSGTLLPFWTSAGFDRAHGAFFEKFEASGAPDAEDETRVRVQARQIYVCAHAAVAGFGDGGLEPARRAFGFLEAHAWDHDTGGWFHRLRMTGAPVDRTKDCYDHAFMLLAMAWLYRAGGGEAVLQRAHDTIAFLDAHLASTRGEAFDGYLEHAVAPGAEVPLPRRQNPHMHLLEALLALYEATGAADWLARAGQLLGLFERHFFDARSGQLIEFFDRDWQEVPQDGRRLREPGHHFEWTWLLHRYAALSGTAEAADAMRPLFDWAWRHGIDRDGPAAFVVFEELDPDGRVLAGGRKRLWPQTEAVKACLAIYERFGDAEALVGARRLLAALFETFADLGGAQWREQVDRDGTLLRPGMPSSSLYHLFLAAAEAIRVLPEARSDA